MQERPCPIGVGEQWASQPPRPRVGIPSYPIPPHPILSHPILSYPTRSHPIPPHPILSHPIPSYPTPFHPIPSYPTRSPPIPFHPIPPHSTPPHPSPPAAPGRASGELCEGCGVAWKVPIGAALQNRSLAHLRVRRSQRRGPPPPPPPGLTFPARAEAVASHRSALRARPARPRGEHPLR